MGARSGEVYKKSRNINLMMIKQLCSVEIVQPISTKVYQPLFEKQPLPMSGKYFSVADGGPRHFVLLRFRSAAVTNCHVRSLAN